MKYLLPFEPGAIHVSQDTTLEGVVYTLTFHYSRRENCYYLTIADASDKDGTPIIASIKVVTNRPLLRRYRGAAANNGLVWPPGELVAVSTTPDDSIAGLGDLGSRVILLYATSDDQALAGT